MFTLKSSALALACAMLPPVFAQSTFKITDLGVLPGTSSSWAAAINELGEVAGFSGDGPDAFLDWFGGHAFRWRNGVMTDLGEGAAWGINDRGQVVGHSRGVTNFGRGKSFVGSYQAVLWQNGVRQVLDVGAADHCSEGLRSDPPCSWAYGINARGQVVGFGAGFHAFLWDNGMTTDLGTLPGGSQFSEAWAVNAQGQVVGNTTDFNRHAFLWQNGVMSDLGTLPGRNESAATGINSRGQVVGNAYDSRGLPHAFLWENGVMTDLGTLGGELSVATGINDRGQVVGSSYIPLPEYPFSSIRAFLWQNGVMTDLGALPGQDNNFANGINNRGQVIGASYSFGYQKMHAVLWETGTGTTP